MFRRCSYRKFKAPDKEAKPEVKVPLPGPFQRALDFAFDYYREAVPGEPHGFSRETIAGEFLQIALVQWFEGVTGMRIGEFAIALDAGREFELRRRPGDRLVLAEVGRRIQ